MDLEEVLAGMRALCVEHLGEDVGAQLSELAMRGVGLRPVGDGEAATGHCRLGGPALLDPGTPWPQYEGFPLSLLAILDADSLAEWVDGLPAGAGLLNVFFLRPDTGYKEDYDRYLKEVDLGDLWGSTMGRVVRADPQRAVEVPAPPPASRFEPVPLYAAPIITLPDPWDWAMDSLRLPDTVPGWYVSKPGIYVDENLGTAWREYSRQTQGRFEYQAFGWPELLAASPLLDADDYVHLLELGSNELWEWSEGGALHFFTPKSDLRNGDFTDTVTCPNGW
ncbi:hypothetical protein GCM10009780_68590 [Actinomadura alba]